jgi:kynurenine formamidase
VTARRSDQHPTAETVRGWLRDLSNWGRWGTDDELGTLNLIGPEQRRHALALARDGTVVSCAVPITFETAPARVAPTIEVTPTATGVPDASWSRPRRYVIESGTRKAGPDARVTAYDAFLIAPHGPVITHLDAPLHTVINGVAFNGHAPGSDDGRGSVEAAASGVVGRGVLLDVAAEHGKPWLDDGEEIHPDDLDRCEARAGVRVGPGDLLFVRTGYRKRMPGGPPDRHAPRPGLQAACLPWLRERDVAVVGADVPVDVIPHEYGDLGLPVHAVGMWAIGLWLIDNCLLEELAATCRRLGRSEFLAVLAPLALRGGTGSPINPLAVF